MATLAMKVLFDLADIDAAWLNALEHGLGGAGAALGLAAARGTTSQHEVDF